MMCPGCRVLADLEEQASLQGPELTRKVKEAGFLNTKARQYKKQAQQLQVNTTSNCPGISGMSWKNIHGLGLDCTISSLSSCGDLAVLC